MERTIQIITVNEKFDITVSNNSTLEAVLRSRRIPPSLFQAYKKNNENYEPIPIETNLSQIPTDEVILRCIRNTDFQDIIPQKTKVVRVKNPVTIFSDIKIGNNKSSETLYEVNSEIARKIVDEKVQEFIKYNSVAGTLIAGISGGGDSNALVHSLSLTNKKIICYTIILDPIWPQSAAERAKELCVKYNIEHYVYGPEDLEVLLNMKKSIKECFNEYLGKFGNNTSHFFGTYLISLVGRKLCNTFSTKEYVLGFNREDMLSDLLFSIINSKKPLEFPVRDFNGTKLLMPLSEIPKKILDACYPKYSFSNYIERAEDESTFQRNLIYYLAHGIEDVYPNLGLSIMKGLKNLFKDNWASMKEEKYGLYVSEYADSEKVSEVKNFFTTYFED